MKTFPAEFADLLTPAGRRILDGRDRGPAEVLHTPGHRFVALPDVVDRSLAAACLALLDRALLPSLKWMDDPIPPETIAGMVENYAERLPKTVRVRTALLESRREKSFRVAEEVGLVRCMRSETFGRFAAASSGRALKPDWGIQALCYGPGDYSGPHNDHHPEEREARLGYLDMHVSLASGAVAHQWLVYEKQGHFSEIVPVHTLGGMNVYRLPFWHYTTPLVAKPGREADARRWLLLGTFLYASERSRRRVDPPPFRAGG